MLPQKIFTLHGLCGEEVTLSMEEVFGYPGTTTFEGGYDMRCSVCIQARAYGVEAENYYCSTGTVSRLRDGLAACVHTLSGEAKFYTMLENMLHFDVVMTSRGHAVVRGEFQERSDVANVLRFEIETDQTCLAGAVRDMDAFLAQF